jgi:hypothetical protein
MEAAGEINEMRYVRTASSARSRSASNAPVALYLIISFLCESIVAVSSIPAARRRGHEL